ncbi:MAG: hypothetical protein N3E37_02765 [Candidatus Micrarchaeota archaeon]|nr:hypothetical protein [Candidatus Micrarchaeota archaeon]
MKKIISTCAMLTKFNNRLSLVCPTIDLLDYEILVDNTNYLLNKFMFYEIEINDEDKKLSIISSSDIHEDVINNLIQKININMYYKKDLFIRFNTEYEEQLFLNIISFSKTLILELLKNPQAVIRFNKDADGISGCYAFSVLPYIKLEHKSPIYGFEHATKDILTLKNYDKKVVILIDFGSNEESLDALMCLKENNVNTFVIDHHPVYEETKKYCTLLNSYEFSKNSDITSGYLCSHSAFLLNLIPHDLTKKLAYISFAGDKSKFLNLVSSQEKENYVKIAESIDFIATYHDSKDNIYLQTMLGKLIHDKEFLFETISNLNEENELMKESILKYQKIRYSKNSVIKLVYLNLQKFQQFKSKSKICNIAMDLHETEKVPFAIVAYSKEKILLRINSQAYELGYNTEEIIEKLKSADLLNAGGGHKVAASISFKKQDFNIIMRELEDYFDQQ